MKKSKFYKVLLIALAAMLIMPSMALAHQTPDRPIVTDDNLPDGAGTFDASIPLKDMRDKITWPEAPSIGCRSAYLIECNTGQVLYAKNEDEDRYPASITKVLTALVVIENCDLNEMVTFSHASVTDLEDGGYNGYFCEGEVLSVKDCLYALLLSSVNECGYALAEHVGGSIEGFAAMMNEKAKSLGCTNSNFVNPHGLNNPNHITTAHDMALIFRAAIANPTFLKIDSTLNYHIESTPHMSQGFDCSMHNQLCNSENSNYYSGAIAGKTGYTSLAHNTLVTYAVRDGVELIAVTMKGEGTGVTYTDTKKLFDYGFSKFETLDMNEAAAGFGYWINTVSPLPITSPSDMSFFVPTGTVGLALSYSAGAHGTMGNINLIDAAGTVLYSSPMQIDSVQLASALPVVPPTSEAVTDESQEPTSEATATEEPTSNAAEPTEPGTDEDNSGSTIGTILKVLLYIVLILIALVFGYWIVIQILKARRRKKRREYLERKRRAERIERIKRG
ncbi:MAG: serine hydrolase [Lachnospiraceae bacterium]|nr:serine hydrolase [Candidatus Minthocola equi]